jgi:hypothetical protein
VLVTLGKIAALVGTISIDTFRACRELPLAAYPETFTFSIIQGAMGTAEREHSLRHSPNGSC